MEPRSSTLDRGSHFRMLTDGQVLTACCFGSIQNSVVPGTFLAILDSQL